MMRSVWQPITTGIFIAMFCFAGCAEGGGGARTDGDVPMPDTGSEDLDADVAEDGGSEPDSGVVEMDSGVVEMDSGVVEMDSGVVAMDSGVVAMDSGVVAMDSGVMDMDSGTSTDGGTMCMTAAECSDGLACNGVERCELGRCVDGTPPSCDDGIACTDDTCVEAAGGTGSCTYTPNDALCGSGQMCNATTGCVAACAESPCRLVSPQCGCAGGQGCYLSGSTRTCAAAGSNTETSTCSFITDCSPGLACLGISADATMTINQCNRFCDTDADCDSGAICSDINDSSGVAIPGAGACTVNCALIGGGGCATGARCHVFRESAGAMRWYTDCVGPTGVGGQGAMCMNVLDCQTGFDCIGDRCLRWCPSPGTVGTAGGCSATEACYSLTPTLTIRGATYGVCDAFP